MDTRLRIPDDLSVFERLRTPMWIVEVPGARRLWCNPAGLAMWNAASLAEWIDRGTRSAPSAATVTRMENLRRRFERGEAGTERWTFYPDGTTPVVAECLVSGVWIVGGDGEAAQLAMLVEARPLAAADVHPAERRAYEALRHIDELVSYYDATGEALLRNPAAIRVLGDPAPGGEARDQLRASFVDPAQVAALRACVDAGDVYRADARVCTTAGERWYDTEARALLDPVTGKTVLLVTQRDISERRAHLEELERSRALLAAQAEELSNLAAPVIRVGAGVLALPLIGRLDRERIDVAMTALLERTTGERVSRVVLDLTGAAELDREAADGLLRLVRVLRLQGVSPAISGIHPRLVHALVAEGLDLAGVPCYQTLEHALRRA